MASPRNAGGLQQRRGAWHRAYRGRIGFGFKCICGIAILATVACAFASGTVVQDREYWYREARSTLEDILAMGSGEGIPGVGAGTKGGEPAWEVGVARNVVLFVGDGMGVSTVTAARILRGQQLGGTGEDYQLAFEKFPNLALAKTYNNDAQIGESSACATALLCGVKANFETVGLDSRGRFDNCFSSFTSRVPSLIDWAQHEGKSTGVVTTTRVTHGTPAALYAHSASRYWEDDGKVPPGARHACKDIARQFVEDEPGRNINVMLGGGRRHWLPKVARDPEATSEEGRRLDGRNLVDDWMRDKKRRGLRGHYVWNKGQFDAINPKYVDHLLGLFAYSHMDFEADRDKSDEGDPSLAEMTRKAIQILSKNPQGFFLFVEGGRIDHAHHYNNAYRALEETLALEAALEAALPLLNPEKTLIVFTADHSHVLTLGGIATRRGNPILGVDAKVSDVDGMPYTTLLYGNGPGFGRENLTGVDTGIKNAVQQSGVPRQWATHGGEDVPVYARGPGSSLFRGSIDQTYLPHAMAYAACIGEHKERCKKKRTQSSTVQPPPGGQVPSLLPLATGGRKQQGGQQQGGSGGAFMRDACDEQSTATNAVRTAAVGASIMSDDSSRRAAGSSGGASGSRPTTLLAVVWTVIITLTTTVRLWDTLGSKEQG